MEQPEKSLLFEYLHPNKNSRILILEGGDGWLASQAASIVPDGVVLSLDRDIRQVFAAQSQLANIPNATATRDVFPKTKDWDIVLLPIPKERQYSRRLLLTCWDVLKPGGQLLLSGPSKGGAKAAIKDAERLFGNAVVLGYRSHQRVASCIKLETKLDPLPTAFQQPGIAPGTRHFIKTDDPGSSLIFESHPGIFSWKAVDEGSALLLDNLSFEPGKIIWDVGCGYGVIGLTAAATGVELAVMSDVNLIAIDYAQKNAAANGLNNRVKILPADALSSFPSFSPDPPQRFNLIVSNPAFHQGRKVDKSMADQLISQASKHLATDGRLVIVANRFLNYDKSMRQYYKNVSRIAESSKFHIIEAING